MLDASGRVKRGTELVGGMRFGFDRWNDMPKRLHEGSNLFSIFVVVLI